MIKRVLLLGILLSVPSGILACTLPPGEVLRIGCSEDCSFLYRLRLKTTSWVLGYNTNIISLTPDNITQEQYKINGLLIPGGADIDPDYYLPSVSPELQKYTQENRHLVNFSSEGKRRDPFEYQLVKTYSEDERFKNLPLLGICRGMQMMSVVQGVPLYLDIKTELGIKNRKNLFDLISVDSKESLMGEIYSRERLRGFKIHHQGIRVPYYLKNQGNYPDVRVTAFSHNKKIAEALEYTHRPALGVQYHPEKSFTQTSAPVFRWFLKKACEHKNLSLKDRL